MAGADEQTRPARRMKVELEPGAVDEQRDLSDDGDENDDDDDDGDHRDRDRDNQLIGAGEPRW